MQKKHFRYLLPLLLLLIATACEKGVNDPAETSAEGTWHYFLPIFPGLTTDTLNIFLAMKDDQSYSLVLLERDDKLLYNSNGIWEATEDSVFLTGNDCVILDTTTDPDSTVPLDDSICTKPIPLELPSEANSWIIETSSLSPLLKAFPIPEEAVDLIPGFIPNITLIRQDD